ncbi:uncharacterized protein LOC128547355 [Mercenaria mercenaria]|uniref:uncharacterized protein LOC128547355 n=1 Tax=Mercenaria mercenaria TaxID=6596 RepID=UPI00234EE5CD|nr:uncharacterized protein LOC128547355 [Mercenaria mercenaria]
MKQMYIIFDYCCLLLFLAMSMNTEQQACVICKVKDEGPTAKLGTKGCMSLVTVSKKKGDLLCVSPGQIVHLECRRVYCHPNQLRTSKEKSDLSSSVKTRKSGETAFDFESKCIFCGTDAKQNENKRGYDVFPVRTLEFQQTIKNVCKQRNDEWGNDVLCRLEFVHDLRAAEARYHQVCSVNFRTGYQIPTPYKSPVNSQKRKKGRPTKKEIEDAFFDTMKYFENHEHDQVTLSDLVKIMSELCGDDEAYGTAYMKKRMIEHFGDAIIISELNGKHDVVTFKSTAHSILHSFYAPEGRHIVFEPSVCRSVGLSVCRSVRIFRVRSISLSSMDGFSNNLA